jgi:hypothetical protein
MKNEIVNVSKSVWDMTVGTTRCQSCKYGVQKSDDSYDMDDCSATISLFCPAVQDELDLMIHWVEVCLTEIEWVKNDADRDS